MCFVFVRFVYRWKIVKIEIINGVADYLYYIMFCSVIMKQHDIDLCAILIAFICCCRFFFFQIKNTPHKKKCDNESGWSSLCFKDKKTKSNIETHR